MASIPNERELTGGALTSGSVALHTRRPLVSSARPAARAQRVKLDPLLVQLLGLVRRGLAIDRAVLDLAVVHFARLFGKSLPNIISVPGEMFAQFLQLLAELMLLRR